MQYLTFEQYVIEGGTLDESAFNRNISRVCGIVKNATHGRIDKMSAVPSQVKAVCRELVEYFANDFGSAKQISSHSQSAGGVSESSSFVIRSIEERAGEIDDVLYDYLGSVTDDKGTPLLYRGCNG